LLKLRNEITQLRQQPPAAAETARSETNVLPNAEEPQVQIAAKFVLVPTDDLKVMGVVWTSSALGSRTSVLSAQKFEALNDAMREASDVHVISAPQVVTFSGRQARLSVTKAVPLKGTNANVGASLDVIPYFLADAFAFDLHVTAELSQLTGDASTPVVGIRQATNRTTLLRGQTLVLANEIPSAGWLPDLTNVTAGPRSLLVFVTPRVVDTHGLRESQ
jgi:type II secretory pathway component GspD/PulD (secretin)